MNKDIDNALDEVEIESLPEGEFEGELFLSTDGKNTVHVKSGTKEGRKAALAWAKAVYESLRSAYGTKQQLNVLTYDPKEDLGKCLKCGAPNKRSKKGKVYCSNTCWLNK